MADGLIPVDEHRVLGHEFSGRVSEVGAGVKRVSVGERVAVMPWLACGRCASCRTQQYTACLEADMLGVERDGAFAETVCVPERAVYCVPGSLSDRLAAYAEPVAAALAVLNAPLPIEGRGVIWGNNRFAHLSLRILSLEGLKNVACHDPERDGPLPRAHFDYAIETGLSEVVLQRLMESLRPGGLLILKSRVARPVRFDFGLAVRRELRMHAVHYGGFDRALSLLAKRDLEVEDLLGPAAGLDDFTDVFDRARRGEAQKLFFAVGGMS